MINSPESIDTTNLVRAAQTGDRNAQALLIEKHWGIITKRSEAVTGASALADDAANESALKILHNLSSFNPDAGSFENWVSRVTHNQTISLLRAEKRHARRIKYYLGEDVETVEEGDQYTRAESLAGPDTSRENQPEDAFFRSYSQELLRKSITQIGTANQRIVMEQTLAGLTFPQIRDATGILVNTLKSSMSHAKAKVREDLAAQGFNSYADIAA